MTVPTPDDVFSGIHARLTADADFATRLPGGAWFGRKPSRGPAGDKREPATYLVGTVEEPDRATETTGGKFLQTYMVELTVWCASTESAAAQTQASRAWLDSLIGWTPADPAGGLSVPNSVAVFHVKPTGGSLRLNPELRKSQDVLAAGKRVEVVVEGQR